MNVFIQRVPAAMFACTFMKTLFTTSATTNWTLMAFMIYTIEKKSTLGLRHLSFLKTFLVSDKRYFPTDE